MHDSVNDAYLMTLHKSFLFMLLASVFCAAAWLAHGWAQQGREQAQQALLGLEQTRAQIEQLRLQLQRWEAVGQHAVGRIEPVALRMDLPPAELARSAEWLAGLYREHGHFRLEHFILERVEQEAAPGTTSLSMTVRGEKIFTSQRAPESGPTGQPGG